MNGTYGYKNFITDEEKLSLLEWTTENEDNFLSERPYRKYHRFIQETPITKLILEIKNRIINLESITDWKQEPRYLDYIGINSKGGNIHIHTDPNDNGYIHTRYNVILSFPEKGGDSIYGGNINKLEENMVWKCVAGNVPHGSTIVESEKRRITLSLGFLIKEI